MNVEEIVNEIIAKRTRRRVAEPRPKRVRSHRLYARPLNLLEVCEFKAAIAAAIERKEALSSRPNGRSPAEDGLCAGSDVGAPFCWKPNCPRCMPA